MTQLERFISTGEIEIGPHPDVPNRQRLLVLDQGMHFFPVHKQIGMTFTVHYLDENGDRIKKESLKSYTRPLEASGDVKLDVQTMQPISRPGVRPLPVEIPDPNGEEGDVIVTNQAALDEYDVIKAVYDNAPSEYDHFVGIANADVNIFQVMLNITMLRASVQGGSKFDK